MHWKPGYFSRESGFLHFCRTQEISSNTNEYQRHWARIGHDERGKLKQEPTFLRQVQDMSRFEQAVYWLTSTSLGQRVWFGVGISAVLMQLAALLSISGVGLLLSILLFVLSISYAFWLRSEVTHFYWEPYSNTPGHGRTLGSRVSRATNEQVSNFTAFYWGAFYSGSVGVFIGAWLGQNSVDPISAMAGGIVWVTNFATALCSMALMNKLR